MYKFTSVYKAVFLFLLAGLFSCTKLEFDRVEFSDIAVITTGVSLELEGPKAIVGGEVKTVKLSREDELMERGIVWSTSHPFPDFYTDERSGNSIAIAAGVFSIEIGPIEPGVRYYARAYASVLDSVLYGDTISFAINWRKQDYPAGTPGARSMATAISNGTDALVAFGNNAGGILKDSWLLTDEKWSQTSFSFTGTPRTGAVGFTLDGKYFTGLGKDAAGNLLDDFWQFDPASGWGSANAGFPVKSEGAIAFSIGNKGYAGMGKSFSTYFNQLFEIAPGGNWQPVAYTGSVIPEGRTEAVVFTDGNLVYIGLGRTQNGLQSDFYAFNPDDGAWEALPPFPPGGRRGGIACFIGGKGYVGMGISENGIETDIWEFDPQQSQPWRRVNHFPGTPRANVSVIPLNGKVLIGLGNNAGNYLDDWWEFTPG